MNAQLPRAAARVYSPSLESIYLFSGIYETTVENRTAALLSVVIVTILLALIGFGGVAHSTDIPQPVAQTQGQ
jgi:hypothetical protein